MDELIRVLRASAEPTRLRLVALCADSDLTVSELVRIVGQSQPRVSRHLKILTDAGVLTRLREGSWVFYRLAASGLGAAAASQILGLLPEGDVILAADRHQLTLVKFERQQAASDYFRQNARSWDEIRSLHVNEEIVEEALVEFLLDGGIKSALDVGTGTARIVELLAKRAESVDGIDSSHEMLSVARSNLDRAELSNCRVQHGDMYQLPFESESYDVVTIHQVLHYADDPARVITEAARVLRPGGRLIIADFAPHDLELLRDEHQHRRLGFADSEIEQWAVASSLLPGPSSHLSGGRLTVAVWAADKPSDAKAPVGEATGPIVAEEQTHA